jgi:alpha-tubulin suppressor-like RCC1 family protein
MASKINADEFVDREGEGKPTLPKGVVLSGVTTITTAVVDGNEVANSTGINAGIITSTHFAGNLTGDVNAGIVTVTSQTVVGSAVTISASGIDIGAGVITATSYAGSGANLTGIGATIMVWEYNPDPYDRTVTLGTGIGFTFNQQIKAGSGDINLRLVSVGGTIVQAFGVGSSVTINNNELSLTPTSDLSEDTIYFVDIPGSAITNNEGTAYVGTGFTFQSKYTLNQLFGWGLNQYGAVGNNVGPWSVEASSPVQIPGNNWSKIKEPYTYSGNYACTAAIKNDGTLWSWGYNKYGNLGQNSRTYYSSPVQIPGTTWSTIDVGDTMFSFRTDNTLWAWGKNSQGQLGQNSNENGIHSYSSPTQLPGTTWKQVSSGNSWTGAVRTDGTLWMMGYQNYGQLGLNNNTRRSSPTQLPGTTWSQIASSPYGFYCTRTDGTLWAWGQNTEGSLGQNNRTNRSSPVQIPGTDWAKVYGGRGNGGAIRTDGTLWVWGFNVNGSLGVNSEIKYSSPVQVPGTTWQHVSWTYDSAFATKTDGTLWVWGKNSSGMLGLNSRTSYSSPVQIPGTWDRAAGTGGQNAQGIKTIEG